MIGTAVKQLRITSNKHFYTLFYLITILTFFNSLIRSRVLKENSNCGFDGEIYCSMARGELGFEPYSRRTLLPTLTQLISTNPTFQHFYIINSIICVLIIFIIWKFMRKINPENTYIFIAILILNPSFVRMLFVYPVLTDFLALLLVIVLFYNYFIKDGFFWEMISYAAVAALVFVRENISLTFAISLIISNVMHKKKLGKSIFFLTFTIILTYLSFQQESRPSPDQSIDTSIYGVIVYWLIENTKDFESITRFVYLLILGIGISGLAGIMGIRTIFTQYRVIYIFALILFVSGAFLGGDNARISSISGILFSFIWLLRVKNQLSKKIILVLTLILWMPLYASDGTNESYFYMYAQRVLGFEVTVGQVSRFLLLSLIFLGFVLIYKRTEPKPKILENENL